MIEIDVSGLKDPTYNEQIVNVVKDSSWIKMYTASGRYFSVNLTSLEGCEHAVKRLEKSIGYYTLILDAGKEHPDLEHAKIYLPVAQRMLEMYTRIYIPVLKSSGHTTKVDVIQPAAPEVEQPKPAAEKHISHGQLNLF